MPLRERQEANQKTQPLGECCAFFGRVVVCVAPAQTYNVSSLNTVFPICVVQWAGTVWIRSQEVDENTGILTYDTGPIELIIFMRMNDVCEAEAPGPWKSGIL